MATTPSGPSVREQDCEIERRRRRGRTDEIRERKREQERVADTTPSHGSRLLWIQLRNYAERGAERFAKKPPAPIFLRKFILAAVCPGPAVGLIIFRAFDFVIAARKSFRETVDDNFLKQPQLNPRDALPSVCQGCCLGIPDLGTDTDPEVRVDLKWPPKTHMSLLILRKEKQAGTSYPKWKP